MNKASARDIQVFVGGALAVTGFRTLAWMPLYATGPSLHWTRIVGDVIASVALPIGLGILFGRALAILWAQIYLWLAIGSGLFTISLCLTVLSTNRAMVIRVIPELLTDLILLAILLWSRSRKFTAEAQADGQRAEVSL